MKNILNCHSVGLHSFVVDEKHGLLKRVFLAVADTHNLWRTRPLEIAIHPHHVDIKITVLAGKLTNIIYEPNRNGQHKMMSFRWNSVLLGGSGGFESMGESRLELLSRRTYKEGDSFSMTSCELHTVFVPPRKEAAWIVEEQGASCGYDSINYSNHDLTKWNPTHLYKETSDETAARLLKPYQTNINAILRK